MQPVYRVIAVRTNGERLVIDECLPLQRAEALRSQLATIGAFREIELEFDEPADIRQTTTNEGTPTVDF